MSLPDSLAEVERRVIARCLQKDPADRYTSARELLAELLSAPEPRREPVAAPPPIPWQDRAPSRTRCGALGARLHDESREGFTGPRRRPRSGLPTISGRKFLLVAASTCAAVFLVAALLFSGGRRAPVRWESGPGQIRIPAPARPPAFVFDSSDVRAEVDLRRAEAVFEAREAEARALVQQLQHGASRAVQELVREGQRAVGELISELHGLDLEDPRQRKLAQKIDTVLRSVAEDLAPLVPAPPGADQKSWENWLKQAARSAGR